LLPVPKVRKLVVRLILIVGLRMHRDWLMGY
jgi:hypothetical protein